MKRSFWLSFLVLVLATAVRAQGLTPIIPANPSGVAVVSTGQNLTIIMGGGPYSPRPGSTPGRVEIRPEVEFVLREPGTYAAGEWQIAGDMRLAAPGNYFVSAKSGGIAFGSASAIRGPETGTARITFLHNGEFVGAATVGSGVVVNQALLPPPEPPPLVNLSMRVTLAQGQTITSGFVIAGTQPRRVLIRAVGPTLGNFGIRNAHPTPSVTLFNEWGNLLLHNEGWNGASFLAAASSAVGAFPLSPTSKDAAVMNTLAPGIYTVRVGGGAGEVLVEVYLVE